MTDRTQILKARALIGDKQAEGELALRDMALDCGLRFKTLVEAGTACAATGEDLYTGEDEISTPEGFWDAWEKYTGRKCPPAYRDDFFRCAC